MLSEADRLSANRLLSSATSEGTRDELGFAPIHFAFADRFFPGTSVQHAQLRYVFFVAWSYQELLSRSAGEPFDADALFDIERRYSRRLMAYTETLENSGISGWMKYRARERPMVRASTIYWTALRSWRMASCVGGLSEAPTESQLRGLWPRLVTRGDGDEGKASTAELFDGMPQPPAGWGHKSGKLDFELRVSEARYLRKLWRVSGRKGTQPLLSRLAEEGVVTGSLWSERVRRVAAAADRPALAVAERAASVACIARAAYAALIERTRNDELGLAQNRHSDALTRLVDTHRDLALDLDLTNLAAETGIDRQLTEFIRLIKEWVSARGPLEAIARPIVLRERELKNDRAYLVNEKRRRDWSKGVATPLDYRWPVVSRMIECVRAVS
jgi:hypothetical protein